MRELARRTTMSEEAAARLEQELVRRFATAPVETSPRRRLATALAAAALIVLAVGLLAWYPRHQPVTLNDVTTKPSPIAEVEPAIVEPNVKPQPIKVIGDRARPRAVRPGPRVVHPVGFVPVPTAAALPQFESGIIVRLTLPVAALPSYGVDISPAASGAAVEADLLVGQDGMARAIRLVNTSRSQQ